MDSKFGHDLSSWERVHVITVILWYADWYGTNLCVTLSRHRSAGNLPTTKTRVVVREFLEMVFCDTLFAVFRGALVK